ncbi:MAG: hypothetical protein M5U28_26885 [Sandaracinaceae bacterium]|nr:hypothetical protein [Sandaracinaceae bacterium]
MLLLAGDERIALDVLHVRLQGIRLRDGAASARSARAHRQRGDGLALVHDLAVEDLRLVGLGVVVPVRVGLLAVLVRARSFPLVVLLALVGLELVGIVVLGRRHGARAFARSGPVA